MNDVRPITNSVFITVVHRFKAYSVKEDKLMGFLKEVLATGLADKLYRNGFEHIGVHQWERELWEINGWACVVGEIHNYCDKYEISVHRPPQISDYDPHSVEIWRLKGYKSFEEALGVLTKHVRICQNKFPHLLFYRAMSNEEIGQEPPDRKWTYKEFLNNKWVTCPQFIYLDSRDWEPLRSVVKGCSTCVHFDDGVDAYFDDGDDEKLFAYEENVKKCRENYEFKCLQEK